MLKKTLFLFFLLVVGMLLISACGPQSASVTPELPQQTTSDTSDLGTLRMALIPVLDVLPFFVAQEQGYFAEEGIEVEFVAASSALEREQLLIAGDVDGMLTDVIGPAITNAAASPSVTIVAVSRRAYDNAPLFRLLASPESAIAEPADLAQIPIGISENSVIQYLGDRLLEQAGVPASSIVFESVPSIPTRFTLMMEGQLDAAILPDPLASAAMQAGAIEVIDDTVFVQEQYSQSVLSFSNATLSERPEAVRAFLRAWFRAVERLNTNAEEYRNLFLENVSVPESVQDTYVIPPFPVNEVTSREVWDDVNAWLVARGIIESPADYEASVDPSFLPSE